MITIVSIIFIRPQRKKINLKLQLEVSEIHPHSGWCYGLNTLGEEQFVNVLLPLYLCNKGQFVAPLVSELMRKNGEGSCRFEGQNPCCL